MCIMHTCYSAMCCSKTVCIPAQFTATAALQACILLTFSNENQHGGPLSLPYLFLDLRSQHRLLILYDIELLFLLSPGRLVAPFHFAFLLSSRSLSCQACCIGCRLLLTALLSNLGRLFQHLGRAATKASMQQAATAGHEWPQHCCAKMSRN